MRWSCLQVNVLLLPESYRRLPAGLLVSCSGKAHPWQRRNWSIRREEPSTAITADLRPFVTHTGLALSTALLTRHPWRVPASISMQNVNWRTRRPPFFHHFSNYSTPTYVVVVLFVVIQRSLLHTDNYCWGTGIAHSCRGSRGEMTSIPRTARYVVRNQAETAEDAESTGEHHRIPQHASFRFFPGFVLFDGFI